MIKEPGEGSARAQLPDFAETLGSSQYKAQEAWSEEERICPISSSHSGHFPGATDRDGENDLVRA
jgi:hypothetical protein